MAEESLESVQKEPTFIAEPRRKRAKRKKKARKVFAHAYSFSFRFLVLLYCIASLIFGISFTREFDKHHANFSVPLIIVTYPVGIICGFIGTYFLFLLVGAIIGMLLGFIGIFLINLGKGLQSLVTNYEHMARAFRIFPSKTKAKIWRNRPKLGSNR